MTVNLISNEGTALILFPDGKTEAVPGESRKPSAAANVAVAVAKGDGSTILPASLAVEGGGAKLSISKDTRTLNLVPGTYRVQGEEAVIAPEHAYTLLFIPMKGKIKTLMMRNSQDSKPVGAGVSH